MAFHPSKWWCRDLNILYLHLFIFAGFCLQDADAESRIPFANSGNPVMSLVSNFVYPVFVKYSKAYEHFNLWFSSHLITKGNCRFFLHLIFSYFFTLLSTLINWSIVVFLSVPHSVLTFFGGLYWGSNFLHHHLLLFSVWDHFSSVSLCLILFRIFAPFAAY